MKKLWTMVRQWIAGVPQGTVKTRPKAKLECIVTRAAGGKVEKYLIQDGKQRRVA